MDTIYVTQCPYCGHENLTPDRLEVSQDVIRLQLTANTEKCGSCQMVYGVSTENMVPMTAEGIPS